MKTKKVAVCNRQRFIVICEENMNQIISPIPILRGSSFSTKEFLEIIGDIQGAWAKMRSARDKIAKDKF